MKITAVPISCFIVLAVLFSCTEATNHNGDDLHNGKMFVKANAYATPDGFGYEIYADDSLYIKQAFIPGIAGEHSFASKEDAMKIAEVAIHKMATQQAMPRITKEDLVQQHIQLPN